MCDNEMEQRLRSVPIAGLSAGADQRIIEAVLAADPGRNRRWWSRRVPLWQAAAACLVIFLATLSMARSRSGRTPAVPQPIAEHRALAETDASDPPPYRTDISKWKILTVHDHGAEQ